MILFINASPKLNEGNSKYFCDLLNIKGKTLYIYKDDFNKISKNIEKSDTIIFSFPTYIDMVPPKLIEFIEFYNGNYKNKNIYILVNCGFLENYHNNLALEFMKNYIEKKEGIFKGFLNIGSGEVLKINKDNKLLHIISGDFYRKIKKFRKAILKNKEVKLNTKINFFTKEMYVKLCNYYFKRKISE